MIPLRLCAAAAGLLLLMGLPAYAQATSDITGLWRTDGYGWVFEISSTSVKTYQVTEATCVPVFQTTDVVYEGRVITAKNAQFPGVAALLADPSDLLLTLTGDKLVFDTSGVVPILASRIEALPSSCADGLEESSDPQTIFEVFWHMFAENYAFFDLYGVNWQTVYNTYRPQVTSDTSDGELFVILQQALTGLTDAHINLIASPEQAYKGGRYATWTQNHNKKVVAAYRDLVTEKYVLDARTLANDVIVYGHLSGAVGYINILAMQGFSEDGDDLAVLEAAMPTIVRDLADTQTIVVDVRFNGGGDDANAIFIAGYFAEQKTLAFSKRVWDGSMFLEKHDIFIEPATRPHFTQAVYLLTSNYTTSAGEVFTLTMNPLPQVISIGETTQGAFSDILFVFLPNGWLVTLSNEEYASHDGIVYEGTGVPPQIEVPMNSQALETGQDPILERVLTLVQQ
jgi:carboxyl-terminal processing protease